MWLVLLVGQPPVWGEGGGGVLFAQHLLDEGHAIGNMGDIMKVIHITGKGRMLNTLESFHVYK